MPAASNVIDLNAHRRARQSGGRVQDVQPWLYAAYMLVPVIWVPVWFGLNFERGEV